MFRNKCRKTGILILFAATFVFTLSSCKKEPPPEESPEEIPVQESSEQTAGSPDEPLVIELAVGIGFGPLVVLGSYYVQAQRPSLEALWASIPIGLLITAVLYVNEFPDYHADRTVGRKTLPVVLGRGRAAWGYVGLLVGTYVVIMLGAVLGKLSGTVLIALLTVPLAYRAIRGALRFHSNTARLVPTQAATIRLHLTTGLLLCLGCGMAGFVYS